jgi:uncharacterized protein YciI
MPEPTNTATRVAELTRNMWKQKFYALLWHGGDADLGPLLADHLEYMIGLERDGKLLASGPLDFGKSRDGLTILRVASAEEAREIANKDPFVKNGVRSFTIREWTVMEGSFGLTVRFSDRSIEIS